MCGEELVLSGSMKRETILMTAKCRVNTANNTLPVLKDVFTKCTLTFRGWK